MTERINRTLNSCLKLKQYLPTFIENEIDDDVMDWALKRISIGLPRPRFLRDMFERIVPDPRDLHEIFSRFFELTAGMERHKLLMEWREMKLQNFGEPSHLSRSRPQIPIERGNEGPDCSTSINTNLNNVEDMNTDEDDDKYVATGGTPMSFGVGFDDMRPFLQTVNPDPSTCRDRSRDRCRDRGRDRCRDRSRDRSRDRCRDRGRDRGTFEPKVMTVPRDIEEDDGNHVANGVPKTCGAESEENWDEADPVPPPANTRGPVEHEVITVQDSDSE